MKAVPYLGHLSRLGVGLHIFVRVHSCALSSALACLQVKSRVAVLNQRHPERTIWKESAICTKTWNSSVLQLIDVSPPQATTFFCQRMQLCMLLGFIITLQRFIGVQSWRRCCLLGLALCPKATPPQCVLESSTVRSIYPVAHVLLYEFLANMRTL